MLHAHDLWEGGGTKCKLKRQNPSVNRKVFILLSLLIYCFIWIIQVLVRFPTGERKERRFHSTTTLQSLYDYVDSLGCLAVDNYSLVSNFPRTVYGAEKLSLSLKDAGLHPQASLFIELSS